MRGEYGKKELENANTKATGGLEFPLLAFIFPPPGYSCKLTKRKGIKSCPRRSLKRSLR
jgi:hypothetical protein